ncbi:hypothetical protein KBI52_14180 [Microvirga sp. HBU67558]|uniref:hypothetical protein n=1 Tax=Microvirga TaxID=186650 RepID=UPI001B39663A|nr:MULTISPECIES: hypothetical protein [unclassified Microvirga]MBQ0821349.1 hypothetical protein [Microvirga sp. HBU67558]
MIGHKTFDLKSFTAELLATTLIGAALLGPASAQGLPNNPGPAAEGADNLMTLLPLLLTSPDRRQLAAELETSIRTGDRKKAEDRLNAAIEVGTLAIVLVDHLNNPDLVATLQGLGIRGEAKPAPEPAAAAAPTAAPSCPAPLGPVPVNLVDMQQALDQERSFSTTVSQSLTGLMQEHGALEARLKQEQGTQALAASEMQQALQREREQSQAALQEADGLREQVRSLQAAREQDRASVATTASERDALLRQERDRRDRVERELAGAHKKLRDLQAASDERTAAEARRTAELEKALAWARTRSDMLTQELLDTSEELDALQEPRRPSATPVVLRLAATGTEPPLVTPPQETPVQAPPAPPAVEARPSWVETGRALLDVTSALPPKQPPGVVVAALPDGIEPLPLGAAAAPPAKAEVPAAGSGRTAPEPAKPDERLILRAEELFHKGDVSGARLLLERALDGANPRAAFVLAETFDPNVLTRLGVLGIRGDAAKARELYARARAMGVAQAGERLEALK